MDIVNEFKTLRHHVRNYESQPQEDEEEGMIIIAKYRCNLDLYKARVKSIYTGEVYDLSLECINDILVVKVVHIYKGIKMPACNDMLGYGMRRVEDDAPRPSSKLRMYTGGRMGLKINVWESEQTNTILYVELIDTKGEEEAGLFLQNIRSCLEEYRQIF